MSWATEDAKYVITAGAQRNITNMQQRVWDIGNAYGLASHPYDRAAGSFTQMLMTILRWPGKVFAEDDLSLIINSSITIGIIWHPDRTKREDDKWVTDPLTGEWSSHS